VGTKVIVKQLGGGELGAVTVDGDGQVHVNCFEPELGAELEAVVKGFMAAPLLQITGGEVGSGADTRHRTWAVAVQPRDSGFLEALADAVTRSRETVGGKGMRAWVTTDGPEES
jgi:hypothetical protein